MSNQPIVVDQSFSSDDSTTTLELVVQGDVTVTVVLQKGSIHCTQPEAKREAIGKAQQLLAFVQRG